MLLHVNRQLIAVLAGVLLLAVVRVGTAQEWAQSMAAACFTDTCMALGLTSHAEEALLGGEGTNAALITEHLQYWFAGETPLPTLLVAARYRDGRLVRYATSSRIMLTETGTATALVETSDAIGRAFRPVAEPDVTLRAATQRFPAMSVSVALTSLVGHLPPTHLVNSGQGGLLMDAGEELHDDLRRGEYGVLILVPQITEQRDADVSQSFGLLVRLDAR